MKAEAESWTIFRSIRSFDPHFSTLPLVERSWKKESPSWGPGQWERHAKDSCYFSEPVFRGDMTLNSSQLIHASSGIRLLKGPRSICNKQKWHLNSFDWKPSC